ncbi:MAG: late competence development ComFB family protein [Bacillota bacterium]
MILRNTMEDAVYDVIDYLAAHADLLGADAEACFCTHCRMDVAAIALNHLAPKYVVTKRGEALAKAERFQTQFDVDLLGSVVSAIRTVKQDPRHCVAHWNA